MLGRIVGQLFLYKFHTDCLSDIDNIVGQFLVEGIETAVCVAYGEIICAMLESVEMLVAESVAVVVHSLLGLGGMKDIGMDQTSGSMGLGDTVDFYYIIVRDVALKKAGFLCVTISKNRMGSADVQFNVKVDWPHMRLSDIDPEDMELIESIQKESMLQEEFEQRNQYRGPQPQAQQPPLQQPQPQPQQRQKKEKPVESVEILY